MNDQEVVKKVCAAIELLKGEKRPLQVGVHERSFAHRLAVHMESLFEEWDIDCEYNRHRKLFKELDGIRACDGQRKTERIFPDIIVHKRTNDEPDEENLLAIEMKNDDECDDCDKLKLELLTKLKGQFKYRLGLYINIGNLEFKRTWYKDGTSVKDNILLGK